MTYSEYIKNGGKGIIQLLQENQCLSYLPSDAITLLDTTFNIENGMKNFTTPVLNLLSTGDDLTMIAGMLKVKFNDQWKALYLTLPSNQEPLYGTVRQTTGTTTIDNTNTVAGFDDNAMVNDSGSNQNGTNNVAEKSLDYTQLTKLLDELKNNSYYGTIFMDIRNYMFTTVYGNERE